VRSGSARARVRPATVDDRKAVVRALARAFERDPLACFALRDDAGKARALETTFDVAFRRWTLPAAGAWLADEGAGAALWVPPGQWNPLRAWPDAFALARSVGWMRLPRVLRGIGRIDGRHPKAPHWYLFAIGVDPDHQGRGVGSALLDAVLSRCDELGEPAYLEASTEANARLYARYGFTFVESVDVEPGGPTARLMWREPVGPRRATDAGR
jgi:ribosomal protein S18 acetylase RimI-like enzyme